ncbi:hypothetical protein CERZMDRAFT_45745 [Cercospora zeae-maydis SCOH1-5]|uniref:Cell wall alpha-1,3-glucan synthase Mok11-14/Ags1-like transmembrane domain-containing protein n=1 Tax=Cercospora zeae-maydis SCOH1-5 TaxID=717836 RepID=A0A6A6FA64_9PEZI|nr:hypothetical protein CERZMDRAFT_45745 [Cercospora zeae-maydis SCOH1-5]
MSNRSSYPPPVPEIPDVYKLNSFPASRLSLINVVGEKNGFNLQKVDPLFTDSNGHFYRRFSRKLEALDGKNSESDHCIEDFLVKSEKEWFNEFRNAKLGTCMLNHESATTLVTRQSRPVSFAPSESVTADDSSIKESGITTSAFALGDEYKPPRGLRKWMQVKLSTWPLYAYFLALGQIIAANSYQITLLTGEVGRTATKLYTVASIYLVASMLWWYLFRRFASVVALSFFFYGLALFVVGLARFAPTYFGAGWVQNVGTGFYALASVSAALFFALNFGDEDGAPIKSWVFHVCLIQGSHYYRQPPGKMPSFYRSIGRRKVILWFFMTAVVQNFFLSAP